MSEKMQDAFAVLVIIITALVFLGVLALITYGPLAFAIWFFLL